MSAGREAALPIEVLLVEDNPGDVRLTREAFRDASMAAPAERPPARRRRRRRGHGLPAARGATSAGVPRPDLILLDLNLPRMDGREVLALIKADENLRTIPTVILTTSEAESDILKSYQLQANCYLSKPVQLEDVREPDPERQRLLADEGQVAAEAGGRMRKSPRLRLLLVEDSPGDARLLREMFGGGGLARHRAWRMSTSMSEAEGHLAGKPRRPHPARPGLARCARAGRRSAGACRRAARPLVVLTGLDDETLALSALQEGAEDYLVKGQIESRGLLRALRYAIERKILEEALFVEKERAQVTLNCIGDAVVCTDIAGSITFLNLVAEKMTGWSCSEAIGQPVAEVLRVLDATSREVSAGSDADGGRSGPDDASAVELASSSAATDSRSRSKTPSLPSTTAKGRPPARSSSSATSARPGRWRCR